ncbi:Imm53 family immunity protein [Nonomuraea sp. KM88]|uniref:Imm53 family immunity protein n=1 Tax=Nonomuraea sp. KM88 TaxID=3457427 RepID=UPI003FCC33DD
MITDALVFLQSWYASCSNDGWEHGYGITIDTLDNPGWRLKIDLVDTPLAGVSLDRRWWNAPRTTGYTPGATGSASKEHADL